MGGVAVAILAGRGRGTYAPPGVSLRVGVYPSNFPHIFMAQVFDFTWRRCMTMEDILRDFVLQLLRRGFTVAQIAEALASQKIALMQADEYLAAIKESDQQP